MADNKVIMEWALELGNQAFTEARGGDVSLLNRLGRNPGLKLFLDNVVGTKNVKTDQFMAYYPREWKEISRLYEEYAQAEQVTEAVDKVATLETKFDTLLEMVQALSAKMDAQQPAAVVESVEEKTAPKKGKKPAKQEVVEAEAVEDTEVETPAEEVESEE
jgi:hypothetical protein